MKELVIISILYCFDFVMNLITLGHWGYRRGQERIVIKIKNQN